MSSTVDQEPELSPYGDPATGIRIFGWLMLASLLAFMINNVLTVRYEMPGVTGAFSGDSTGFLQLGVYVVTAIFAVFYVLRTPDRALRWDARNISNFNAYLVRGFFFAVLFCGIVDSAIAFMRVENLLGNFVGPEMVKDLGRARFIGPFIHIPLIVLGFVVALFTRTLGFMWLALLIVLAELLIVISRFVFSYEQALMGDLVRYWYAALFLFASAYTLIDEGHVRVDVLYAAFSSRRKGIMNAIGTITLGLSTAWVIIFIGFNGKTSIINSPVANFEVTQTGGVGMFVKYQMAAFLGIFAITMLIQFIAYLFEAVADWRDEPGKRVPTPIAH